MIVIVQKDRSTNNHRGPQAEHHELAHRAPRQISNLFFHVKFRRIFLSRRTKSGNRLRKRQPAAADRPLNRYPVPEGALIQVKEKDLVIKGDNTLEFLSANPPVVIPGDPRPLAIALQNMALRTGGGAVCAVDPR